MEVGGVGEGDVVDDGVVEVREMEDSVLEGGLLEGDVVDEINVLSAVSRWVRTMVSTGVQWVIRVTSERVVKSVEETN